MEMILDSIAANWPIWLVSAVMIFAAVIDGLILKVPNWLTFPFILCGWAHGLLHAGLPGLGWSLAGTAVGLALLLVVRAIGGMGGGDVKLLAGLGAWVGVSTVWWAFVVTTFVGAIMAIVMIAMSGHWRKHYYMARQILHEWKTVRDPEKLFEIAKERKPTMTLLPYGIPMAIGSILYFAYAGMLI
ncbi:Type IV leader peptidase family protein [Roseimaritima multifibrata]|uniref:Type IV leader peptidase family protein n=1 Tax=Roseimaritima multifibrata TaxID=1930274 RepID=A0A517MB62_9BACT|nr:A24 family peptidase [Roseimaritima multifibrata]QDS92114.1 Type IV leader peptidase family protein [Roseimaritima multifibrata]